MSSDEEIDSLKELDMVQADKRLAIALAKQELSDAVTSLKNDLPGMLVTKVVVPLGIAFIAFKGVGKIPDLINAVKPSHKKRSKKKEQTAENEDDDWNPGLSVMPLLLQVGKMIYENYFSTDEYTD